MRPCRGESFCEGWSRSRSPSANRSIPAVSMRLPDPRSRSSRPYGSVWQSWADAKDIGSGADRIYLRAFIPADQSYRPKNSLAAGLIISGLHIGSNVSWAFTVSTPSMESVSVSTCSWIKSPTGHIGLVRLKVTST
jgi:hypothetical protein